MMLWIKHRNVMLLTMLRSRRICIFTLVSLTIGRGIFSFLTASSFAYFKIPRFDNCSIKAVGSVVCKPCCNSANTWAKFPVNNAATARIKPGNIRLRNHFPASGCKGRYCPCCNYNHLNRCSYTTHIKYSNTPQR